jgi:hypothetical protein
MNTRQIRLIIASAVIVALTAGSLAGAEEIYSGGVTVDINREVQGYLWVEDATVNLLENAYIKNADYYGDVYAVSGSVLNIYGGKIDGYLYVTTSYNDMPEAQVTIYGSDFAIDGVPIAQGTSEVFLQNQQLSGAYQDGTVFSHWVDCFVEGSFYLTVKLGWIISKPEMTVTSQSLNFGQVKVGSSLEQAITIANQGTANLSLQSVSFVQDSNPGFNYTPLAQLPLTLEPGGTVSVKVVFSPALAGEALGVLKIAGDDADTPVAEVVLTGTGIVSDIAIEPVSLDFGQRVVGTSAAQNMTIANHGDAQLIVQSIAWADGGSADFAISAMPAMPLVIEPNGLVDLEIVYMPTVAGTAAATLEIASDDPDQPVINLTVAGKAVAPVVTPYAQIQSMIVFYEESIQNGTIQGVGHGKSAKTHVMAVKEVLWVIKKLIRSDHKHSSIAALKELDKFTDGKSRPSDWITGPAVAELNARIDTLLAALKTK